MTPPPPTNRQLRFKVSKWKTSTDPKLRVDPELEIELGQLEINTDGGLQQFPLRRCDFGTQSEIPERHLRIELFNPSSRENICAFNVEMKLNTLKCYFRSSLPWINELSKQTRCGEFAFRVVLATITFHYLFATTPKERFDHFKVLDANCPFFFEFLKGMSEEEDDDPCDVWYCLPSELKTRVLRLVVEKGATAKALASMGYALKGVEVIEDASGIDLMFEREGKKRNILGDLLCK